MENVMNEHLEVFTLRLYVSSQSETFCKSVCREMASCGDLIVAKILVSSAYRRHFEKESWFGRSLMVSMKRRGPIWLPWGMPEEDVNLRGNFTLLIFIE